MAVATQTKILFAKSGNGVGPGTGPFRWLSVDEVDLVVTPYCSSS